VTLQPASSIAFCARTAGVTLRHLTDEQPDTPASWVLSELELAVLDMAAANWMKLPNNPTILQPNNAIAALGGHRKRNGPPGWITLMRGSVERRSLFEGAQFGFALAGRKNVSQRMRSMMSPAGPRPR
jgi:hypothetical protein